MKIQAYLHASYNTYAEGGDPKFSFNFQGCDMSQYGYIFLGEHELDLPVPDEKELLLAQVKVLKAKEMKIQAEAYKECERVREEIQKLMAIEYQGEIAP